MSGEAVLILIASTVVATVGVLILVRRLVARARFDRIVARFERDLRSPWPPAPHEASAAERASRWNQPWH